MKIQNNLSKILLFLSMVFFILSCFVFFFFYREINNSNEESQLAEEKWQNEIRRRDEIRALDDSVKIVGMQKVQLEAHFARGSDIVPFLDMIEGLARKVGIRAEIVSVNIPEDHTGLLVVVKTPGTFDSLYKFLTLLENSPYELEFVSMNMRREPGVNAENKNVEIPKWNATFKIKLLSFLE